MRTEWMERITATLEDLMRRLDVIEGATPRKGYSDDEIFHVAGIAKDGAIYVYHYGGDKSYTPLEAAGQVCYLAKFPCPLTDKRKRLLLHTLRAEDCYVVIMEDDRQARPRQLLAGRHMYQ